MCLLSQAQTPTAQQPPKVWLCPGILLSHLLFQWLTCLFIAFYALPLPLETTGSHNTKNLRVSERI